MAHLVKKKRYLGCLWELETVTLPGGAPTTDFQHWRISFGMQKPRSSKTKVLRGVTKEAIEADMAPFGFISDGLEDDTFTDPEGQTWTNAGTVGDYGDMSHMWEYLH